MNTARVPEGAKIGWIGLGKMGLRPRRWASLASAACGDDHDHRGHDCAHDVHSHHLEGRGIENFVLLRRPPSRRQGASLNQS